MVNETLDLEEAIPVAVMQACCGDICPMPHCGPFGECDDRGERPVNVGEELKTVIGEGVGHELAQIVLAEENHADLADAAEPAPSKTKSNKRKKQAEEKPSAKVRCVDSPCYRTPPLLHYSNSSLFLSHSLLVAECAKESKTIQAPTEVHRFRSFRNMGCHFLLRRPPLPGSVRHSHYSRHG